MVDDKLKHKPQKKHTLEEVLKSLQDLIRNDLIAAQQLAHPMSPPALPQTHDSFDAALDTLDHLIDNELVTPVTQARAAPPAPGVPEDDLPTDEIGPDDDTLIRESLEAEAALNVDFAAGKDLAPPELPTADDLPAGSQNAFAFDGSPVADRPNVDDEAPNESSTEPESSEPDVAKHSNTARSLADDIPVLHEVAHEILSAHAGLPTPEQARDIAVHVVARLNIELRKGGAQPLDPSTIDRLEELLREALASKSSNS